MCQLKLYFLFRWLADKCESNKRPYYYGCQILVKETVNLTGIFNGSFLYQFKGVLKCELMFYLHSVKLKSIKI